MGSLKSLLSIQDRLTEKSNEIEAIKAKRGELFINFATNEDLIISLYYEIEFKKLELLYIKREQITELKDSTKVYDIELYQHLLKRLGAITDRCISSILKRLFEGGYGQELRRRGLVKEYIEASPQLSPQGCVIKGEFVHKSSPVWRIPDE
ncbi:hypothetical protein MKZ07_14615 [Paenibacillus sp. FSL P4-0338]|uniref:hypothetical protein n=1 Tax=Paenibacillus sp. FSL P4-0338 TaxID=2921635 RepID=UPI0030FA2158